MTAARSLEPLFAPTSVAVVGASNDPRKWGNWLARGALSGEARRPAYLVNRRGGQILGRRAYPKVADLPVDAPPIRSPASAISQKDRVHRVITILAGGIRAILCACSW